MTEEKKRMKLKKGEYWCLFHKERPNEPVLIHDPGPYFESNAKVAGHKVRIVRLVTVMRS